MTTPGESQKSWVRSLIGVFAALVIAGMGFVIGDVRAQSAVDVRLQEIGPDIQKIRAMPDPGQVVTRDQFIEVVKRLDDSTQEIRADVQYLRQREEKRGK